MMELTRTNSNKAEMIKNMSITCIPQSVNVYTFSPINCVTLATRPTNLASWGWKKSNSKDLSNRCISESAIKEELLLPPPATNLLILQVAKEPPPEQKVILKFFAEKPALLGIELCVPPAHPMGSYTEVLAPVHQNVNFFGNTDFADAIS